MPFQGDSNAGATDPRLLQLLLSQRENRARLEIDQQKAQMAMEQAARREKRLEDAHALSQLTKRAELAGKLQTVMGPQVDAARRTSEQTSATNLTSEDLLADGGGADFASIVAQNDPTAGAQVQATDEAQENFLTQANFASEILQQLDPGATPDQARSSALGAGRAVESERGREAQIALEKKTAAEQRQEEKETRARKDAARISTDQLIFADSLRDANVADDIVAREVGAVAAIPGLQGTRQALRKQIAEAQTRGEDTTDLEERVTLIGGRIRGLTKPNTVENIRPIPFSDKRAMAQQFRAANFMLVRASEMGAAFNEGKLSGGLVGAITNVRARAAGILEQVFQVDPNLGEDLRAVVGEGLDSGTNTVRISDQLTVGLDQILLAYGVARAGRGNERLALSEIQKVLAQFDFTGVFTTEDQIFGSLAKAARLAANEKSTVAALLQDDPAFLATLQTVGTLPEDQKALDFLNSLADPRPPRSRRALSSGATPDLDNLTDEELGELLGIP